jgi:hypothetical protein
VEKGKGSRKFPQQKCATMLKLAELAQAVPEDLKLRTRPGEFAPPVQRWLRSSPVSEEPPPELVAYWATQLPAPLQWVAHVDPPLPLSSIDETLPNAAREPGPAPALVEEAAAAEEEEEAAALFPAGSTHAARPPPAALAAAAAAELARLASTRPVLVPSPRPFEAQARAVPDAGTSPVAKAVAIAIQRSRSPVLSPANPAPGSCVGSPRRWLPSLAAICGRASYSGVSLSSRGVGRRGAHARAARGMVHAEP